MNLLYKVLLTWHDLTRVPNTAPSSMGGTGMFADSIGYPSSGISNIFAPKQKAKKRPLFGVYWGLNASIYLIHGCTVNSHTEKCQDTHLPKSHSLSTAVSGSTRRFCGLMSLWQTPWEWIYARLRNNWYIYTWDRKFVGEEREKKRKMLLFTVHVHMNGHSSSSHDNTETYFDIDNGDGGLGLVEMACHPVHGFWYKIQHQI